MDTAERAAFEAALRSAGATAKRAKAVIVWAEWRDGQLFVRTRRLGRGEPAPGSAVQTLNLHGVTTREQAERQALRQSRKVFQRGVQGQLL
jgi:tagatose-1,6-bisphosphate aldolase non-catalytic subunit AgaZ/GatZ